MRSLFERSDALLHDDCDGIVTFNHEGQNYMFLVDLKSSFHSQKLYHACEQIISSYIKINMLLHLLPNYRNEDYIVKGFVVMRPYDKSELIEWHHLQLMDPTSELRRDKAFALKLCLSQAPPSPSM